MDRKRDLIFINLSFLCFVFTESMYSNSLFILKIFLFYWRSLSNDLSIVALVKFLGDVKFIATQGQKSRFQSIRRLDRIQFQRLHKVYIPKAAKKFERRDRSHLLTILALFKEFCTDIIKNCKKLTSNLPSIYLPRGKLYIQEVSN